MDLHRTAIVTVARRRWSGWLFFALFLATVVVSNWLVSSVGVVSIGFGLHATAGVFAAGLGFTFRDLLQDQSGRAWVVIAIVGGAILSALFSPQLALASGAAFLASETLDFGVYTPLRDRGRFLSGVAASNCVGLLVDSVLFLWLAFHSLDYLAGQVIAKSYMTILAVIVLYGFRRRQTLVTTSISKRAGTT